MTHRLPGVDRRRQILEVAKRLFVQQGFHATTTRDIARAAGVSDALLYTYFSSKQEVFDAIIQDGMDQFEQSAHRHIPDVPIREYLHQLGSTFLQLVLRQRDFLVLLTSEHTLLTGDPRWARFVEQSARRAGQRLEQRAAALEVRSDLQGYLVSRQFMSALVAYVLLQEVLGLGTISPVSPEDYLAQLIETTLHGILPSS